MSQCPNTEATSKCMILHGRSGWGWENAISISCQSFRIAASQKGRRAWSREAPSEGRVSAASPMCPCCCRSTLREAQVPPSPVLKGSSEDASSCLRSIHTSSPFSQGLGYSVKRKGPEETAVCPEAEDGGLALWPADVSIPASTACPATF